MTQPQHSGAEVLQASIAAAGLGGLPADNPASWPVYANVLPADPHSAIAVTDTTGLADGRLQRTGQTIRHPGWQVRVRALDYRTAWAKIASIYSHFDGVLRERIVLDGVEYTIAAIHVTGDIIPLGPDGDKQRETFTLNGVLTYGPTP